MYLDWGPVSKLNIFYEADIFDAVLVSIIVYAYLRIIFWYFYLAGIKHTSNINVYKFGNKRYNNK